ncbi:hypothetical protein Ahia01_001122500 [Argonauta hians]
MATPEVTDKNNANITSEPYSSPYHLMNYFAESSTTRLLPYRSSTIVDLSQIAVLDAKDIDVISIYERAEPRDILDMQEPRFKKMDKHPDRLELVEMHEASVIKTPQQLEQTERLDMQEPDRARTYQKPIHQEPFTITETDALKTDQHFGQLITKKYRIIGKIYILFCMILCIFAQSCSFMHIYKITMISPKSFTDYFCIFLNVIIASCSLVTFCFLISFTKPLSRLSKQTLIVCFICTVFKLISSSIILAFYPDVIAQTILISSILLLILFNIPVFTTYFADDTFLHVFET